jgi:hypothetical protein
MDRYVFFGRKEDADPIQQYIQELLQFTPEQLIQSYMRLSRQALLVRDNRPGV